ncbi:hypothetical protein SAY86_014963 [Trapa natans]|uniref:Uncharacterized protein n=1 Tax=Trapa natans TaxID=22666 RepID=A0AAN7KM67_TRANT|nr:hypothetical protein SAY86_014963 [Trapa natans]
MAMAMASQPSLDEWTLGQRLGPGMGWRANIPENKTAAPTAAVAAPMYDRQGRSGALENDNPACVSGSLRLTHGQ